MARLIASPDWRLPEPDGAMGSKRCSTWSGVSPEPESSMRRQTRSWPSFQAATQIRRGWRGLSETASKAKPSRLRSTTSTCRRSTRSVRSGMVAMRRRMPLRSARSR